MQPTNRRAATWVDGDENMVAKPYQEGYDVYIIYIYIYIISSNKWNCSMDLKSEGDVNNGDAD